jgi:XTP/dITP diphosphohydrolase
MNKIVLASGNKGKIKEIQAILEPFEIEVIPQSQFNVPEAEETGLCFVENAIIKARNACEHTGLPAISDDSGLVVDYLEGEPGIYSSRYAGKDASDKNNNQKLLEKLQDVPFSKRHGHFHCVMVFMQHAKDPSPLIASGRWDGEIALEAKGEKGFGYDPLFYLQQHHCTAAELDAHLKNTISHRGQALNQLIELISRSFAQREMPI